MQKTALVAASCLALYTCYRYADVYVAAGQIASKIYTQRLVPFGQVVASASVEAGSAGKDILRAVWAPCKFIPDHPEVSVSLAASVVAYYWMSKIWNQVLDECTALDGYIDNTVDTVNSFDLNTISNARARILWVYGIYTPVASGSVFGSWVYQLEIATIDNFFNAITQQRNYPSNHNEQNVKNTAYKLKCMLARRLNVSDALMVMHKDRKSN